MVRVVRSFLVGLLLSVAPAFADDPPTWTGLYAGAAGGWGRLSPQSDGSFQVNGDGAVVGGFVGYRYQFGALVLGLEGSANWSGIEGSSQSAGFFTQSMRLKDYATVGGQVGFAVGNVLIFGKGGYAVGQLEQSESVPLFALTIEKVHQGWMAGAGLDVALGQHWFMRVEGEHLKLGDESYPFGGKADVIQGGIGVKF
jgi:outer membrane immunogenic protein